MRLQDFLKVKKVRCVIGYGRHLTVGETYHVLGLSVPNNLVQVENDNGFITEYDFEKFEAVIDDTEIDTSADSVDNCQASLVDNADNCQAPHVSSPSNNDAPHVSEPKFKVGDKVYLFGKKHICTIKLIVNDGQYLIDRLTWSQDEKDLVLATQENYERLQATFPDINFEAPPKPLTGSDLCRAMFEKGWKYVPCFVSNESDDFAQKMKLTELILTLDGDRSKEFVGDDVWHYAVPVDPRTGEPLTEAVLDE